jgi:hypothetical protein
MMAGTEEVKKPCRIRDRIHLEWSDASDMYATLAASLPQKVGTLPRDQYEKFREIVEMVRSLSQNLRRDLDLHIQRHGC